MGGGVVLTPLRFLHWWEVCTNFFLSLMVSAESHKVIFITPISSKLIMLNLTFNHNLNRTEVDRLVNKSSSTVKHLKKKKTLTKHKNISITNDTNKASKVLIFVQLT